jgi:hypothetical protein
MLMLAALFVLASTGAQATGSNLPGSNTGANAPSAPRERPAACSVVEIRSDVDRRDQGRFSATRILELRFGTRLSGSPKRDHTLRLRLYSPSGFLYQVLTVPVSAGHGHRRVEARLPVAGTSIMASGLYGTWRVVPQLDDSRAPCGAGRSFVIRP